MLFLLVVLVYMPAIKGGFTWDDNGYVTDNLTLRSVDGLASIWVDPRANKQFYPLVFTTFWLEYHLWGLNPHGYHISNVLLHFLSALLLWLILRHLLPRGAWFTAALFALHPVQVESVAWITERKNVLSAAFYFLAVLAYMRYAGLDRSSVTSGEDSCAEKAARHGISKRSAWAYYVLSLFMYICALLSKTVTASLPVAILLLVWWKRPRVRKKDVVSLLPFFMIGIPMGLLTVWLERYHVGALGEAWNLSFVERVLIAGRAVWFYVYKLILPTNLSFSYSKWQVDTGLWWQYLFPLLAIALILTLALLHRRIGKGPLAATLFFIVTLFPALGFFNTFPMLYSYVADHFQYMACIGPLVMLSGIPSNLIFRSESVASMPTIGRHGRILSYFVVCSVLTVMGYLTWSQAHLYDSTDVLWRDTIRKNPLSWMAHNNMGVDLSRQGKSDQAFFEYNLAIKINPNNAVTFNNIGTEYAKNKNWTKAEESYKEALRLKPNYPSVYLNLGKLYLDLGRFVEARFFLSSVIGKPNDSGTERNSNASWAHYYLGLVSLNTGNVVDSTEHFLLALKINPYFSEVHYNLGYALFLQYGVDRSREVMFHYQEALRLNPKYSEAHNNLGALLFSQGKLEEAADHFRRAVEVDPLNCEAFNNLGTSLLQLGKTDEAIRQYRKALEIKPEYMKAKDNLNRALRR